MTLISQPWIHLYLQAPFQRLGSIPNDSLPPRLIPAPLQEWIRIWPKCFWLIHLDVSMSGSRNFWQVTVGPSAPPGFTGRIPTFSLVFTACLPVFSKATKLDPVDLMQTRLVMWPCYFSAVCLLYLHAICIISECVDYSFRNLKAPVSSQVGSSLA